MTSLRVATLALPGPTGRTTGTAEAIRAVGPDVLLLRGVPRYPGSSYVLSALARRSGLLWSGRTATASTTTVMSALRVSSGDAEDRRLPGGLRHSPRTYTVARVQVPDGPMLTVVAVDLSAAGDRRARQLGTVLTDLAQDPCGGPWVLGAEGAEGVADGAFEVLAAEASEVTAPPPASARLAQHSGQDQAQHSPPRSAAAIFAKGHTCAVPGDRRGLDGAGDRSAEGSGREHPLTWVDLRF